MAYTLLLIKDATQGKCCGEAGTGPLLSAERNNWQPSAQKSSGLSKSFMLASLRAADRCRSLITDHPEQSQIAM
eukprot:scaffold232469_cov20-Tisochrysis_lutea.AAC.3